MANSIFKDISPRDYESHSNLVVVYGKNGMYVDRNDLDYVTEEDGKISSLSVVRITSPTPSMIEEEEELEKQAKQAETNLKDANELISTLEYSRERNEEEAENIQKKEKPRIVGITIEDFYPQEEAQDVIKQVIALARVSNPEKIKFDVEFLRLSIQNDHCYTPLTSPSQIKQKRTPANNSKEKQSTSSSFRQFNRSKISTKSLVDQDEKYKTTGDEDDDENGNDDFDEESEYSESNVSESDNDRDSDLDFDVNDRGYRKKKSKRAKKLKKHMLKMPKKRQSLTDKDKEATTSTPVKSVDEDRNNRNLMNRSIKASTNSASALPPKLHSFKPASFMSRIMQKPKSVGDSDKAELQLQHLSQSGRQRVTQTKLTQPPPNLQLQSIVLRSDPKSEGVFTDINTLLAANDDCEHKKRARSIEETEATTPITISQAFTSVSGPITIQKQQIKGFMPLVPDSSMKNQLPAQISIQQHPTPSTLAAEHDKQLDLIDSIVKNDLQASTSFVTKESMNENIPKIVKMLENSGEAVMGASKLMSPSTSTSFTQSVEDIDITNAPLLDSTVDELPDELLQHVVELIQSKNLQDAIRNQMVIGDNQPPFLTQESNQGPPEAVQDTSEIDTSVENQAITAIRKEPVQIVRGDGRVITLPPIEAPTTRAKRRQQSQVNTPTSVTPVQKIVAETKTSTSRRGSQDLKTQSTGKKRASTSSQPNKQKDDTEGYEENKSDDSDDPNKLWCICRQPHNNRFMICCDKCEDWFHGTCVQVTKAQGKQMEQNGEEWTCPKCLEIINKSEKNNQPKITEIFPIVQKSGEDSEQVETPKKPKQITTATAIKKLELETPKVVDSAKKVIDANNPRKQTELPVVRKLDNPKHVTVTKSLKLFNQATPKGAKQVTPKVAPPKIQKISASQPQATQGTVKKLAVTATATSQAIEEPPMLNCIVCRKVARPNSIYCSDDCIRRHAQNALVSASKHKATVPPTSPLLPSEEKKKKFNTFEEALAIASDLTLQAKNKVERVYVYERKSGRLITGSNAPTTANLKKWLQDNPTFEVVQPGSPQALAIERNKQQKAKTHPLQIEIFKKDIVVEPPKVTKIQGCSPSPQILSPKSTKTTQIVSIKPSTFYSVSNEKAANDFKISPDASRGLSKDQQKDVDSKTQEKDRKLPPKKKHSQPPPVEIQRVASPSGGNTAREIEPIRLNVKKTLQEQLILRMNETETKLTNEEVEKFAAATETEMFELFNRDIGAKYKAKYRSLMFNIKDRKNQTLFMKICQKQIEPKQLVRLTPDELASQQLAQWRENETKHQLEMIKKSELDLLSCTKNYVFKTHKGEEVIESTSTDRVSLDIMTPVEDVVAVLNNSAVSSTSEVSPDEHRKELLKTSSADLTHDLTEFSMANTSSNLDISQITVQKESSISTTNSAEKKKSRNKDRDREKERDRHHRSKDKHKHRKRSRSRSRDRDRKHKSPHRDEKKHDTDHSREKDKETTKRERSDTVRDHKITASTAALKQTEKLQKEHKISAPKQLMKTDSVSKVEDFSLIDQILESSKTVEEAANYGATSEKEKPSSSTKANEAMLQATALAGLVPMMKNAERLTSFESDQEPSSTVSLGTPPHDEYSRYSSDLSSIIWNGSINMIDVATFQIIVQPVCGPKKDLEKELPTELEVVGRISPETVWDYIGKIKKSPNKEIVIIRLIPSCESENTAYSALYMYLDKRKRLGVVKSVCASVKDFYILPLGRNRLLPTVLRPQENIPFFQDETRPDMLLGIIIRILGKRSGQSIVQSSSKMTKKSMQHIVISSRPPVLEEQRFTPPGSPKGAKKSQEEKAIMSSDRLLPKVSKEAIDESAIITKHNPSTIYVGSDADEPYSPGGSSDGADLTQNLQLKPPVLTPAIDPESEELKRKMEEINRQIEAQKMEIAGMLNIDQNSMEGGKNYAPALANISIPSNLQQILASINKPETMTSGNIMATPAPPPPAIGSLYTAEGDDEEYVPMPMPAPPKLQMYTSNTFVNPPQMVPPPLERSASISGSSSPGRLGKLSEAELLSMVPDDIDLCQPSSDQYSLQRDSHLVQEPPPPGLEDEFV